MNRAFLFLICFSVVSLFSFNAHAQTSSSFGSGIILTASNESPTPGQKVTITARSYTIDINAATIVWSVNGKVVQKDIGLTSYDVVAPALGKKTVVNVTATTPEKIFFASSLTVNSGSVDMIVENNGFVPSFFHGKVPTSYQNNAVVIAVPHLADAKGVEYDPKTLVYQWKRNSRVVEDQSGYGKQTLTLFGDIVPRTSSVLVTVSTRDNKQKAIGNVTVSYGAPSLSFYVDDPLYGPFWNNAVRDRLFIGSEKETSVLAIPYGFTKPVKGIGDLGLTWLINGFEYSELGTNESVTLRAPNGTSGSSNIELRIRNNKQILQSSSLSFIANFSQKNSNSDNVSF